MSMQDKAGVGGGNSIKSTAYFYRCFFLTGYSSVNSSRSLSLIL